MFGIYGSSWNEAGLYMKYCVSDTWSRFFTVRYRLKSTLPLPMLSGWCQNACIFALWMPSEVKKHQSFAKHTCWKPALSHLTFLKRTKWIKLAQVCERLSSVRSDASSRLVHVNYSITPHRVGWGGKKESIRLLRLEEGTSGSVYRNQHTPASRYACTLICCLLNQHILPAWAVLQDGRKARRKTQILGSVVFLF